MYSIISAQVAASISSGHELVITELIFNGAFTDLGTEQLLAACSCFVCQEKMPAEQKVRRGSIMMYTIPFISINCHTFNTY
jgi:superfamily II RNA helicase